MNVVLAATCCIFIDIIQINCQFINNTENSTNSKNNTELDRLVKERDLILHQIEEAIEDGNKFLKTTNSTQSLANLTHVKELYQHLLSDEMQSSNGTSGGAERRSTNYTVAAARRHKDLKLHLFDFVSLSSKKKRSKEKEEEKKKNRLIMQGRIDEWLLNRELEKKKIMSYMDRIGRVKQEKCPRQGISRKKKKSRRAEGGEDDDNGDKSEKEKKKKKKRSKKYRGGKKYPCCRKCCKRSYLGCL